MLFKSTVFSTVLLFSLLTFVSAVPTKIVERTTKPASTSHQVCTYSCPSIDKYKESDSLKITFGPETYLACHYHLKNAPFYDLSKDRLCQYFITGSKLGACNKAKSHSSCPDSAVKTCNSSKRTIDEDAETDMQRRIRKRQWSSTKSKEIAFQKR